MFPHAAGSTDTVPGVHSSVQMIFPAELPWRVDHNTVSVVAAGNV
jgi:hypothetical protein